jgi:hypothetical protein
MQVECKLHAAPRRLSHLHDLPSMHCMHALDASTCPALEHAQPANLLLLSSARARAHSPRLPRRCAALCSRQCYTTLLLSSARARADSPNCRAAARPPAQANTAKRCARHARTHANPRCCEHQQAATQGGSDSLFMGKNRPSGWPPARGAEHARVCRPPGEPPSKAHRPNGAARALTRCARARAPAARWCPPHTARASHLDH